MKSKVAKLEIENIEFKKRFHKTEEKLNEIVRVFKESLG
jgi:hypothetical protein